MSKHICCACETRFTRVSLACETRFTCVSLACETHSPYRNLVKCVLRRTQRVHSALINFATCLPAASVSIYHVGNFPIHLPSCFLKSHSCLRRKAFRVERKCCKTLVESVLAMYIIIIITLAGRTHRTKIKR